jgi:TPR repeat protein
MPAPANAAPPPAPPAPFVSGTAPVQSSVSVAKQDTSVAVTQEPAVAALQETVARPDVAAKDKAARVEPEPLAARRETIVPRQSTNVAKQETTVVKQEATARGRETVAPPPPTEPARVLDRDEINDMIKRGQQYVANGDMSAARILLKRAAEAGDARAALALGATYDPTVLKELGAVGVSSDVAQARMWYERAIAQGSPEASKRLQQLAQVDR